MRLIVPNTPVIECECGQFLMDEVTIILDQPSGSILHAIESEDEKELELLTGILTEVDVEKVCDFTFNRRVPYERKPRIAD